MQPDSDLRLSKASCFSAAAPELEERFATIEQAARSGVRVIVLRLKRTRNPDAVWPLELLDKFIERMQRCDVAVLLCGVRPEMAKVLESSGITARLRPDRIFPGNQCRLVCHVGRGPARLRARRK